MVALFYILPLHHYVVQKYDKNEVKKKDINIKQPTICQILYSFICLFGLFVFIGVTFTSEALFLILVKATLHSSTDVWINKTWGIHTMECSAIEGMTY